MDNELKKVGASGNEAEPLDLRKRMVEALEDAHLTPKEIRGVVEYFDADDRNPGVYSDIGNATDSTGVTQRKFIVVVDWMNQRRGRRLPRKIRIVVESRTTVSVKEAPKE